MAQDASPPGPRPSRRDFLKGAAAGAALTGLLTPACTAETPAAAEAAGAAAVRVALKVNQRAVEVVVEPRTTLLDALRDGRSAKGEPVDLTGTKRVCDRGTCGSCTVRLDGKLVYACSVLALDAVGHEVQTVEGLSDRDKLHPVQAAFVEHDGLMCGFCTPGFVMASVDLLEHNPRPTREQIQHALSGNTCRCGTYARIFEAVEAAAQRSPQGG